MSDTPAIEISPGVSWEIDPDATWSDAVASATSILCRDGVDRECYSLAESVVAIDAWIMQGGPLPRQWVKK